MMNGQSKTYDGSVPLTLTMTLIEWDRIRNVLKEAPMSWNVSHPLIVRLSEEIDRALQGVPTVEQRPTASA